jgi:shikimate dehydrogenase
MKYAVIGNPIIHSLSPQIHHKFAEQTGIHLSYEKILSPLDSFKKTVEDFFETGQGLNITVPFKLEAFSLAQELSQYAQLAGAVNTLKMVDNKLYGHNTDGFGLVQDIQENLGVSLKDKRIMILGAGGATQGILLPFLQQNTQQILIANRTVSKAKDLVKRFSKFGKVCGFALEKVKGEPVDIVINATSSSLNNESINLPKGLVKDTLCYDLVYGKETPFMQFAKDNGAVKIADGLGMLVEQAALSFEFWHGVKPETKSIIKNLTQQ